MTAWRGSSNRCSRTVGTLAGCPAPSSLVKPRAHRDLRPSSTLNLPVLQLPWCFSLQKAISFNNTCRGVCQHLSLIESDPPCITFSGLHAHAGAHTQCTQCKPASCCCLMHAGDIERRLKLCAGGLQDAPQTFAQPHGEFQL